MNKLDSCGEGWPGETMGICCACGYFGSEDSACPSRDDRVHCPHWTDAQGEAGFDAEADSPIVPHARCPCGHMFAEDCAGECGEPERRRSGRMPFGVRDREAWGEPEYRIGGSFLYGSGT